MLKHRLLFGTLMTVFFTAVIIFGGWLDGSLTASTTDDKPVQATLLVILIALIAIPAHREFSSLIAKKNIRLFTPLTTIASILLATAWYWKQFTELSLGLYLAFGLVFTLLALLIYQYLCCRTSSVIVNCSAGCFSVIYLGLLVGFIPAVRIDFGPMALLMFVFVVKSSDIGAYTAGRLFGRHKLAPLISPGKTWEGMAGAIIVAVAVALLFAYFFGIMNYWQAVIFGFCFAWLGQLGDLAESMLKRDAEQKDASNTVPGFGGILDVLDSILISAPFAYLFFALFLK